jgi:diguanylate cyclase (GGDEF)-like protein
MRDTTPASADSSVGIAIRTARRVALAAFGAAALVALVLGGERWLFHHDHQAAQARVLEASRLADAVLLHDEQLTMSAQLAAASGQAKWAERYEEKLPLIDKAIADAAALAPPAAAQRFDQATRLANDRLVEMERAALAAVRAGDAAAAQALLDSPAYAEQKAVLAQGSDALMAELQAAAAERLREQQRRSAALMVASVLLVAAGCGLLWRLLTRRLARAKAAFDDTQREVNRLALHDPLTGLFNRRYLRLQLDATLARAEREGSRVAVLVLDLDGFKPINDRLGHAAGDAVLVEVARRLTQQVRRGELVARLGGDEFVVVLDRCEEPDAVVRAAQRLVAAVAAPIALAQDEVAVNTGVGVAFFPADGRDLDDLLRRADVALYRAKGAGAGEVRFFEATMDQELREREALQADLRAAIAADAIEPHFQPLVNLADGRLTGFEVLARWRHAVRGNVPPAVFVPIAEDCGLIDAMTERVLRRALRAARDWPTHLTLALNIAPPQLRDAGLVDRLLALLHEAGFPPGRLEVEITETALMADLAAARRTVLALKAQGLRIALDDFGTGYSSLSHLSELPFDKIKIDRSFVASMHQRRESASIVNAIVGLGHSLNVPTTAEGIESADEARTLAQLGCDYGQGFLWARPMPAHDAAAFARRDRIGGHDPQPEAGGVAKDVLPA